VGGVFLRPQPMSMPEGPADAAADDHECDDRCPEPCAA